MPARDLGIQITEPITPTNEATPSGARLVDVNAPLEVTGPQFAEPTTTSKGIFGRLNDIELGPKIASGVFRGLFGQTAKTLVQMPQSFATGALGLAEAAGFEGAKELRERVAKPITVPVLGEVKPLSAVPADIELGAATPKQALGQAIGMLPEAALLGAFTMPGANKIPTTALGKLAQSFGVGAEYGALAGGSRALLEDKPLQEATGEAIKTGLVSGLFSAGLTAASMVPTGELAKVPKDIGNLARRAKDEAAQKLKALMPYTTGIRAVDVKRMSDPDIAPRMLERLKILQEGRQTGAMQEADDALKQYNFEKYRSIYNRGKEKAEGAYDAARRSIEKTYGAKTVGGKNVLENAAKKSVQLANGTVELGVDNVSPVVRIPGFQPESEIVTAMYRRVQQSGNNPNVSELFNLKQDLQSLKQGLEIGNPANRAAGLMVDAVDSELNRLTAGATKPMNAAYRSFKQAQENLGPLWKDVKYDQQLSFVKNLEGQAKAGSRKALEQLEKIAGFDGFIRKELDANRLAKLLNADRGVTGSRILDDVVRTVFVGAPSAVGTTVGAAFGPAGAVAGGGLGMTAGAVTLKSLQSPQFWMPIIMNSFKQRGIQVTAEQAQNLVNSPLFQNTLQTIIKEYQSE